MARIALPWRRSDLIKLGPSWNWGEETTTLIQEVRPNDGFSWNNRIAEWNPTNGILLNVMKEEGILCRAAEVPSVRLLGRFISEVAPRADGSEVCVFGHPKTPQEVGGISALRTLAAAVCRRNDYAVGGYTRYFYNSILLDAGTMDRFGGFWRIFGGDLGILPFDVSVAWRVFGKRRSGHTWAISAMFMPVWD